MLSKQCNFFPNGMNQTYAGYNFFFNFNYNMRLAEQNLNSNRRCLQVPKGHNSYKSILLLTREKIKNPLSLLPQPLHLFFGLTLFSVLCVFAMETNTGTVLGTWNWANTPVCSLHRLTVGVQSGREAFQCADCKGTGVG